MLARNLVTKMVHPSPAERPSTVTILKHPYFWSPDEQLRFLEVSRCAGETCILNLVVMMYLNFLVNMRDSFCVII